MLLTAVIINQLAQHLMPVKRASPSLFFPNINRVSELLHIPTKDASKDSFPGDHGMMLLILQASCCAILVKSLHHRHGYCGGICIPAGDDWRSLADRYRRRLPHGGVNWFTVGADDPTERSHNRHFDRYLLANLNKPETNK